MSTILVTGGTGFVGSKIVAALHGHNVRVLVRSAKDRPSGAEPIVGDVTDPATLNTPLRGVDTVIHLVGIIEEQGDATFDRVIGLGTINVVDAARAAGVRHFILMSALGARNDERLHYMRAKYTAEEHLKASGMSHTIFRPSVIFGPGDGFISTLASLVSSAPVLPVVGDGKTPFSPVAVQDVADAFAAVADDPSLALDKVIEVGGSDTLTYEEMLDEIANVLGKRRRKVHLPVQLIKTMVSLSRPLPKSLRPPVTPEQLKMLSLDNSTSAEPLARLIGRTPKGLRGNIDYIR